MLNFRKEERLTNKKIINSLFIKGSSFFIYPFSIKWNIITATFKFPSQILISIPKRNFKKAVDRNKLKRLVRDAYRINKSILSESISDSDKKFVFTLIYTEKEIVDFKLIHEKIILILQRLLKEHEKIAK